MLRRPRTPSAASDAQVERARVKRQRAINKALGCTDLVVEPAARLEDPDRDLYVDPAAPSRPAPRASRPRSYVLSDEGRASIAASNEKRRGRAPKPRRDRAEVEAILERLRTR